MGSWVTGGSSTKNIEAGAETAVVQVLAPLCVAKAEQQPDQLALLKKESSYQRDAFVIKAGWVSTVAEIPPQRRASVRDNGRRVRFYFMAPADAEAVRRQWGRCVPVVALGVQLPSRLSRLGKAGRMAA